jgi:hypothetical protein
MADAKDDKKKKDEEEKGGKCVISPEYMKLVTLVTLLISDFDVVFTIVGMYSYVNASGVFVLFDVLLLLFGLVYIGGCIVAAKESDKFMDRFKDKVRLNEINGISMEDLEDALSGRRIFWMGPEYEAAKKRKISVEQLKAATPDSTGPEEIEIPMLKIALKEAELAGTTLLRMPGNPKAGAKAVKRATDKLIQAKKVQENKGEARRLSTRRSLGGPMMDDAEDVADPNYKPNAPKSRDQMEGRGSSSAKIDTDGLGDDDNNAEEDFAAKQFELEIQKATEANDTNLVKMCQLASIKHLDSYKVDEKLKDKKGKIVDQQRALYMVCEAKAILHSYHQVSRAFARRIVKPTHSIPYFRLMEFGWQPSISHTDFSGILNANGLWTFTVGIPNFIFSIVFLISQFMSTNVKAPFPCETNNAVLCTLAEDFSRTTPQRMVVAGSFVIGLISLFISVLNVIVDFPAQLFDIAEKEEESLHFTLQAEHATKTWEDKLQVEVSENVKMMLKMSTQFENNSIPGMEAPGLVIEDVMKLERRAMEKKVAYIEHFLTMSEDEKKVRNDLRDGKRKKKEEEVQEDFEEEGVAEPPPRLAPPTPQPLPAPVPRQPSQAPPPTSFRQPSAAIPEESAPPARVPSAGIPAQPSCGSVGGGSAAALPIGGADEAAPDEPVAPVEPA